MRRLAPALRLDGADAELIDLIKSIVAACKEISFRVGQGELSDVLGSTLNENVQGETQKKLDVISNELLKDLILETGSVMAISSEEEESTVAGNPEGRYLVTFDPLDGSSNTDINSLIGTIFQFCRPPKAQTLLILLFSCNLVLLRLQRVTFCMALQP